MSSSSGMKGRAGIPLVSLQNTQREKPQFLQGLKAKMFIHHATLGFQLRYSTTCMSLTRSRRLLAWAHAKIAPRGFG